MRLYRPARVLAIVLSISALMGANLAPAAAQAPGIPSLFNPRLRPEPAPPRTGILRLMTSDDAPPLNFAGPDGALVGFNIDLARALCLDLKAACTIQARRADLLIDALAQNAGDAVIPAPDGTADERVALTSPYLPRPGRFAIRRDAPALSQASVEALTGRTVGVVADSRAAAYLARFFPVVRAQPFPSRGDLLDAFANGSVGLVFDDALDLAFWLNGVTAGDCCRFVGGPFLDTGVLGPGVAIAVRADDDALRRALNGALARLDAAGTIGELYLRYFPIPPL